MYCTSAFLLQCIGIHLLIKLHFQVAHLYGPGYIVYSSPLCVPKISSHNDVKGNSNAITSNLEFVLSICIFGGWLSEALLSLPGQ
jgi:hypothetical protein